MDARFYTLAGIPGESSTNAGNFIVNVDPLPASLSTSTVPPIISQKWRVEALSSGNFYASTGVALPQLEVWREKFYLKIEQDWDYIYTTAFTGKGGATLADDV